MKNYDARLQELRTQIAEKKRLEKLQNALRNQKSILQQSLLAREKELAAEQADVEALEKFSLAAVFYRITGKLGEKLSLEQQEACAAAMKYDAAVKELEATEQQLRDCESALIPLFSCEVLHGILLKEKLQAMKAAHSEETEEILATEQQIADLERREKELYEALRAGKEAESLARKALAELDSAESWNTWDLLGGGGIITHVAKHGRLNEAQEEIYALQHALSRFRTELADVTIPADIQVNLDGFLRFADYFFDGLFADWTVGREIAQSRSQVEGTLQKIRSVMNKLEQMQKAVKQEREEKKAQLNRQIQQLSV